MKKFLFTISLVFLYGGLSAQTDDCTRGQDSARNDFNRGKLVLYRSHGSDGFTATYYNILKKEHGIEVIGNSMFEEESLCYLKYMKERIKEKFGTDIFDKVAAKAAIMDSLGQGNRHAKFPGGQAALMKFVYCNLDFKKINCTPDREGMANIDFTIGIDGKVKDVKAGQGYNAAYKAEGVRVISILPDFLPATIDGVPYEEHRMQTIMFNQKAKEKYCR